MIGLMGLKANGMLVMPNGKQLFRLPLRLSSIIQWIQRRIAIFTWRLR